MKVENLDAKILALAQASQDRNSSKDPLKDPKNELHKVLQQKISRFLMEKDCNGTSCPSENPNIEYVWIGEEHGVKFEGKIYGRFDQLVEKLIAELDRVKADLKTSEDKAKLSEDRARACEEKGIPIPPPNNDNESKILQLNGEKAALEQAITELKAANVAALKAKEDEYKAQLDVATQKNTVNENEVARLTNELANAPKPDPSLPGQLEAATQKNIANESKIAELTAKIDSITAEKDAAIQAAKAEGIQNLEAERAKVSAKDGEIADLTNKLATATNNTEVATLRADINKVTGERDASVTKVSTLEKELAGIKGVYEGKIADLNTNVQEKEQQIKNLEIEKKQITNDMNKIRDAQDVTEAQLRKQIADLEKDKTTIASEKQHIIDELDAKILDKDKKNSVQLELLQKANEKNDIKISELSQKILDDKSNADKALHDLAEIHRTEKQAFEAQIVEKDRVITQLREEIGRCVTPAALETLRAELDKTKGDLQQSLSKFESTNQQLLSTVAALDEHKERLVKQGMSLNAEIAAKVALLKESTAKLEKCEAAVALNPDLLKQLDSEKTKNLGLIEQIRVLEANKEQVKAEFLEKAKNARDQAEKELLEMTNRKLALEEKLKGTDLKIADYDKLKTNYQLIQVSESALKHNLEVANENIANGRAAMEKYKAEAEQKMAVLSAKLKTAEDDLAALALKSVDDPKTKNLLEISQNRVKQLEDELNKLKTNYQLMQVSESTLKHNLESANNNIENGRAAMEKYKADTEQKIAVVNAKLKTAEEELAALKIATDPKNKKEVPENKLEAELKIANGKVERYNADIQKLVAKVKKMDEDHKKELKDEKKRLQDKIDAADKEVRRLTKAHEVDKADLQANFLEIQELKADAKKAAKAHEIDTADFQANFLEIQKLKADAKKAANNANSKDELDKANAEIARLNALLSRLPGPGPSIPKDVIPKNEKAIENLRKEVKKFAREKEEVEAKLAALQLTFDNYKKGKEQELSSMGNKLKAAEDALAKYKTENKIVVNPLGKKDFTLEEMTAKHARLAESLQKLSKELSGLRDQSRLDLKTLRSEKDAEIKKVNDQLKIAKADLLKVKPVIGGPGQVIGGPRPAIGGPAPIMQKDLQTELLRKTYASLEEKYNKLLIEKQAVDAKLIKLTAELGTKKGDNGNELRGAYAKLSAAEKERDGLRAQLGSLKKTDDNAAIKLELQKAEVKTAKHLKDIERLVAEKKDLVIKHAAELRDLKKTSTDEINRLKIQLKSDTIDIQRLNSDIEKLRNKPDAPKVPCPVCPPDRVCPKCQEVPKVDADLQKQLAAAQGKAAMYQKSIENYSRQKNAVEADLVKARADLAKAKTENSQQLSGLSTKLRNAENEVASLKLQIKNSSNPADVTKLSADLKKALEGVESRQKGIIKLQGEKAALKTSTDNEIRSLKQEKETLKRDVAKCKADLAAPHPPSPELATLRGQVTALTSEKAALSSERSRIMAELLSKQGEIIRAKAPSPELAALKSEVSTLRSDKASISSSRAAIQAELLSKQRELMTARNEIKALRAASSRPSSPASTLTAVSEVNNNNMLGGNNDSKFYEKYLKYKNKYLQLKSMI